MKFCNHLALRSILSKKFTVNRKLLKYCNLLFKICYDSLYLVIFSLFFLYTLVAFDSGCLLWMLLLVIRIAYVMVCASIVDLIFILHVYMHHLMDLIWSILPVSAVPLRMRCHFAMIRARISRIHRLAVRP